MQQQITQWWKILDHDKAIELFGRYFPNSDWALDVTNDQIKHIYLIEHQEKSYTVDDVLQTDSGDIYIVSQRAGDKVLFRDNVLGSEDRFDLLSTFPLPLKKIGVIADNQIITSANAVNERQNIEAESKAIDRINYLEELFDANYDCVADLGANLLGNQPPAITKEKFILVSAELVKANSELVEVLGKILKSPKSKNFVAVRIEDIEKIETILKQQSK